MDAIMVRFLGGSALRSVLPLTWRARRPRRASRRLSHRGFNALCIRVSSSLAPAQRASQSIDRPLTGHLALSGSFHFYSVDLHLACHFSFQFRALSSHRHGHGSSVEPALHSRSFLFPPRAEYSPLSPSFFSSVITNFALPPPPAHRADSKPASVVLLPSSLALNYNTLPFRVSLFAFSSLSKRNKLVSYPPGFTGPSTRTTRFLASGYGRLRSDRQINTRNQDQ
jgi:hypothetical protein